MIAIAMMPTTASAHRSGCHRWHSCPSDTGSYVCGDLGYPCRYPTYPTRTKPTPVPPPKPAPPVIAPTPVNPNVCTTVGSLHRKGGTEFYDSKCVIKRSIGAEKLARQILALKRAEDRVNMIAASIQTAKGTAEAQCGNTIEWPDALK